MSTMEFSEDQRKVQKVDEVIENQKMIFDKRVHDLEACNEKLKLQIFSLQTDLEVHQRMETPPKESENISAQSEFSRDEFHDVVQSLNAAELGLGFATQKVHALESELEQLKSVNAHLSKEVVQLMGSIEESKETNFSHEVDLMSLQSTVNKLGEELKEKDRNIKTLNTSLDVSKQAQQDLEEELILIQNESESHKNEIKVLQNEWADANEVIHRFRLNTASTNSINIRAPSPLNGPSSPPVDVLSRLRITCEQLADELLAQNAANDLLQEEIKGMSSLNEDKMQRRNDIFLSDNMSLHEEIGKLREFISLNHSNSTSDLIVELEELRSQLAACTCEEFKNEIDQLREAVFEKHEECGSLREEIRTAKNTIEQLRGELENAKGEVELMKAFVKTLQNTVCELQKQSRVENETFDGESIGSQPPKIAEEKDSLTETSVSEIKTPPRMRRLSGSEAFRAIVNDFEKKSVGSEGPSPLKTPSTSMLGIAIKTSTTADLILSKPKETEEFPTAVKSKLKSPRNLGPSMGAVVHEDDEISFTESANAIVANNEGESYEFKVYTATFLTAIVRGYLTRMATKRRMTRMSRVILVTLTGASNLMKVHEALSSSGSVSPLKTARRPSVVAEFLSNFQSEVPHAYVLANSITGQGQSPCSSIAKSNIHGPSFDPRWEQELQMILAGQSSRADDKYPEYLLTFNVFSQSGHAEDTFLGQASVELDLATLFGRPLTKSIPLHHAYQPIYLRDNEIISVHDLKEYPVGTIDISLRVLSMEYNIADQFYELQTNIFSIVTSTPVWVVLREGALYFYSNNCDLPENYTQRVDCRKIVDVREVVFEQSQPTRWGIEIVMVSGGMLNLAWSEDDTWTKHRWLKALRSTYDDTSMFSTRLGVNEPKTSREFTGTPRAESVEDQKVSGKGGDDAVDANMRRESILPTFEERLESISTDRLEEIRAELIEIYTAYAPEKIEKTSSLLTKFKNREEDFLQFVKDKYMKQNLVAPRSNLTGIFDRVDTNKGVRTEEVVVESTFNSPNITPREVIKTPRDMPSAVRSISAAPAPKIGYTPHILFVNIQEAHGLMSIHEVHKVLMYPQVLLELI